jgi:hypothetical protein
MPYLDAKYPPTKPPVIGLDEDAEMAVDAISAWVGVDSFFSVWIRRLDDGVGVEIFAKGYEDCLPIADCHASKDMASAMQAEGWSE